MTTILLLRHGQSVSNLARTFTGQMDIPLTALGYRQAQAAAQYLRGVHFDAIYASPLVRALDTARPIAKALGLAIQTDPDLMEACFGDWEGKKIDEEREAYNLWKTDPDFFPPKGESMRCVRDRAGRAMDRIAAQNEGKTVLVATHGGFIRMLPSYYTKNDADLLDAPIASNVSVTTLIYENGKGRIEVYADDSYLGDMVTQFDA